MESKPKDQQPWVERYRPKNLQEVSHQKEVVATLENAVATGNLPHLLFYGPPGTGKTSVALALCRQLWHPSQWRRRVMELNASDERGIRVVRDKIKHFATLAVGDGTVKPAKSFFIKKSAAPSSGKDDKDEKSYPNPPFKIIILDEADTVTPDAQAALRRIIEAHSHITRFILICNYVTRIIEPLASRCAKFRFQSLPPASMKERLSEIASNEGCGLQSSYLDYILELAEGDMRKAVTTLQSAHILGLDSAEAFTSPTLTENATSELAELTGVPPPKVIGGILDAARSGNFGTIQHSVEDTVAQGYSSLAILRTLFQKVLDTNDLSELSKARLSIRIAEAEHKLMDGADEFLQLMTVATLAMTCYKQSTNEPKN